MTLNEILETPRGTEISLSHSLSLSEPIQVIQLLTLLGEKTSISFTSSSAVIQLSGHGPFRFRGLDFVHETKTGPSFFLCEDAVVVFEDCQFRGALGGPESALATAVKMRGRSRVSFERCYFRDNDTHIQAEGHSICELRQCSFQEARADGIVLNGQSSLIARELEMSYSGWSAVSLTDDASSHITTSKFKGNGCHGLELKDQSSHRGSKNTYSQNSQHGLSLQDSATLLSVEDKFQENSLCGIDFDGDSTGLLRNCISSQNKSHGFQLRGRSRIQLLDSTSVKNAASGLAVFDQASLQGEDLHSESNSLSGIQVANKSRLNLCRSHITLNKSSGILGFSNSRLNIEKSRVLDSGGYGLQASEQAQVSVKDCEFLSNQRGGIIFAGSSQGLVEGSILGDNFVDGVVSTDRSKVTLLENLIQGNKRDGILLLSSGLGQFFDNQCLSNLRNGLFAANGSKPLISEITCAENQNEQLIIETDLAREAHRGASSPQDSSTEILKGVTISVDGAQDLHIPFQPKKLEKSMLCALVKHGRLSEAALGKVAKTRRVGGAMENLIDRLNKAGMPFIRHDGDGPEGNIYAFKLDTTRIRKPPSSKSNRSTQTQGRDIC